MVVAKALGLSFDWVGEALNFHRSTMLLTMIAKFVVFLSPQALSMFNIDTYKKGSCQFGVDEEDLVAKVNVLCGACRMEGEPLLESNAAKTQLEQLLPVAVQMKGMTPHSTSASSWALAVRHVESLRASMRIDVCQSKPIVEQMVAFSGSTASVEQQFSELGTTIQQAASVPGSKCKMFTRLQKAHWLGLKAIKIGFVTERDLATDASLPPTCCFTPRQALSHIQRLDSSNSVFPL